MGDLSVSGDSGGGVATGLHWDCRSSASLPDVLAPAPETAPPVSPTSGPYCGGLVEISQLRCGVTVIGMAGEIDLASAPGVERAVLAAVDATPGQRIIIELNRVEFFGACAIRLLLAADTRARRHGGHLHLVADDVAPAARAMHCVPELDLPVTPTLTAAMTSDPTSAPSTTSPAATLSLSLSGDAARKGRVKNA